MPLIPLGILKQNQSQSDCGQIEHFKQLSVGDTVRVETFDRNDIVGTITASSESSSFEFTPNEPLRNWQLRIRHDSEGEPLGVVLDHDNVNQPYEIESFEKLD